MSLRERLTTAMKEAMKAKDQRTLTTVRLINAAVKDKDISARTGGKGEGISDADILSLLQSMIKQRQDSIKMYEDGGRPELAKQEQEEIDVIKTFLPEQMDASATESAVEGLIAEVGAESMKDMGRVMAVMKEKYAGQMDMGLASGLVKKKLA